MKKLFLILLSFSFIFAANKGMQSLRLKGTVTAYDQRFPILNRRHSGF